MEYVNLTKEQLEKLDCSNERFVEIEPGLVADKESCSYYNNTVKASELNNLTTLNIISELLDKFEQQLDEKLRELKKDIVEDLTPASAKRY